MHQSSHQCCGETFVKERAFVVEAQNLMRQAHTPPCQGHGWSSLQRVTLKKFNINRLSDCLQSACVSLDEEWTCVNSLSCTLWIWTWNWFVWPLFSLTSTIDRAAIGPHYHPIPNAWQLQTGDLSEGRISVRSEHTCHRLLRTQENSGSSPDNIQQQGYDPWRDENRLTRCEPTASCCKTDTNVRQYNQAVALMW